MRKIVLLFLILSFISGLCSAMEEEKEEPEKTTKKPFGILSYWNTNAKHNKDPFAEKENPLDKVVKGVSTIKEKQAVLARKINTIEEEIGSINQNSKSILDSIFHDKKEQRTKILLSKITEFIEGQKDIAQNLPPEITDLKEQNKTLSDCVNILGETIEDFKDKTTKNFNSQLLTLQGHMQKLETINKPRVDGNNVAMIVFIVLAYQLLSYYTMAMCSYFAD